ncbi:MAG: hypothetical protein WD025_08120, partial [Bacteriovoracaceae bacterium]
MKTHLDFTSEHYDQADLKVVACYEKEDKTSNKKSLQAPWTDKDLLAHFKTLKSSKNFTGSKGDMVIFNGAGGETAMAVGMGTKTKAKDEEIRRA